MENKYKLNIYPSAQQDMEKIFAYISLELANPIAANNLIDDFEEAFEMICIFPESYPIVKNEFIKNKTLRKIVVKNYIIFYSFNDDEINVFRILHGMRKYENLF